ncbi:hypothetical protein GCM10020331_022920 [Ectobacillus funiculus]
MIDASHHPFEENVETTKKVVEYAHANGISVEAELGTVGGQEDDVIAEGVIYADPQECAELVKRTGIDCLAPALGSVHGPYKGEPNLGFKEMEEVRNLTGVPLVLHGGTGIPKKRHRPSDFFRNIQNQCEHRKTKSRLRMQFVKY